jgi:hypothetical protein
MSVAPENSALVTKTLLYNGSAALTALEAIDLPTFLDFCALCEAAVLLDRMYALQSPNKIDGELVSRLRSIGVLSEFVPQISREELRRVVARLPRKLRERTLTSFWNDYRASYPKAPGYDLRPRYVLGDGGEVLTVDYEAEPELLVQPFDYPIENKMSGGRWMGVEIATAQEIRDRLLRSNAYLVVAAANGFDYFPDFDRAPMVAAYLASIYRSLPVELYQRVADALEIPNSGDEIVREWSLSINLPIPPVTALVLHRSRTLDEVPDRLLELRNEFASYRKYFREFKQTLQSADTLKKRRMLRKKYERLLAAASGPDAEIVTATEMLNLAEKLTTVASGPRLPTTYSAALLTQPYEWIRKWWIRRPLSILFRMDGKLPNIPQYRSLLAKHWGSAADDSILNAYAAHADQVRQLMFRSETIS